MLVVAGDAVGLVLNGVPLVVGRPGCETDESLACQRHDSPACQRHDSLACQRHDITQLIAGRNELRLTTSVVGRVVGSPARHGRIDLPESVGRVWLEIIADGASGSA